MDQTRDQNRLAVGGTAGPPKVASGVCEICGDTISHPRYFTCCAMCIRDHRWQDTLLAAVEILSTALLAETMPSDEEEDETDEMEEV